MYKKLLTMASILVALCACRKESENVQTLGNTISFSPAAFSLETKAGIIPFPTTGDMGVFAWRSDAAWSETPTLVSYMNNTQATYDDLVWRTSYKWPAPERKLHFLCYSPYSGTSPFSWTQGGALTAAGYSSDGVDLCYSDFTVDQSRAKDNDDPADILMHHALSKISFALAHKDLPDGIAPNIDDVEINVVSITLSGLNTTGDFSATQSGTVWTDPAWSNQSGTADYTYTNDGIIVMPQALAAGTQKITVTYTITTTFASDTENPVTSGEITETHDLICGDCDEWDVNKHYKYTVKLDAFGEELTFTPATAEWNNTEVIIKIGYEDPAI